MAEEVEAGSYRRTSPASIPRRAATNVASRAGAAARRAATTRYTPRIRSSSAGRYSRPVSPPQAMAGPIAGIGGDINSYLAGDTGYQQQLRSLAAALSNFTADVTRRRGSLTSEFGLSKKALGDQRVKDLESLEEDYGSRSMLRSGLYGTAVGDYEKEYGERQSDLLRRQNEALATLTQEQSQFGSQQQLSTQAAREAAIRRRAELLGM